MTAVLTGEFYEQTQEYDLLCSKCKKKVGRVTRAEASALSCYPEEVMCFACDGFMADMIPVHLYSGVDEAIVIYHPPVSLYLTYASNGGEFSLTVSSELALGHPGGLSSSPYLHGSRSKEVGRG